MNKNLEVNWIDILDQLLKFSKEKERVSLQEIVHILSGKGVFLLLILLSLPFCLPIPIPGLSTPFGVLMAIISLRVVFRRKVFLPNWILKKEVTHGFLEKLVSKLKVVFVYLKKKSKVRLSVLTISSWIKRCHGVFFLLCSLFLAMPIPIPLTNFLVAAPIILVSLGILEEDGLLVVIGYSIVVISILIGVLFIR